MFSHEHGMYDEIFFLARFILSIRFNFSYFYSQLRGLVVLIFVVKKGSVLLEQWTLKLNPVTQMKLSCAFTKEV